MAEVRVPDALVECSLDKANLREAFGVNVLAIRRGAHIRMTAFDVYLPKIAVKVLDILADLAVCILGVIMMVVGWNYATTLGGRGFYVSMPWLSRFWMYFPVPLAGVAMVTFEIESLYNHIKSFFVKEEM